MNSAEMLRHTPTTPIYLKKSELVSRADTVFTVYGDGMSPIIRDGDSVLVRYTDTLEPGAIGVFMVNDRPFIRQYYPEQLRSFRPDLETEHLPAGIEYEIFGEFLGVITADMLPSDEELPILEQMDWEDERR